jgi:hypothetical protein
MEIAMALATMQAVLSVHMEQGALPRVRNHRRRH